VEYNHYWFREKTLIFAATEDESYRMTVKPTLDTVKVGVNWRFWSGR
jgi:hypothetical protein